MSNLYTYVTTENVDLNYECFKKEELIECISNLRTTYFRFKEENQQLIDKINTYEDPEDLTLMFMYCDEKAKDKIKQLKEVREKAIKYIKEHTMYFDSEYASIYGELCSIPGAGDTRIHCVIGDKELLQILDGEKDVDYE